MIEMIIIDPRTYIESNVASWEIYPKMELCS